MTGKPEEDFRETGGADHSASATLRKKTPAEKIEMVAGLHRLARALIKGRLRTDHPDWDDAKIAAEVAKRISRGSD